MTGDRVERLGPKSAGVWWITAQGTRHLWDCDSQQVTRFPTIESQSGSYEGDRRPLGIALVIAWPTVGETAEFRYLRYRRISVVKSIERLDRTPRD